MYQGSPHFNSSSSGKPRRIVLNRCDSACHFSAFCKRISTFGFILNFLSPHRALRQIATSEYKRFHPHRWLQATHRGMNSSQSSLLSCTGGALGTQKNDNSASRPAVPKTDESCLFLLRRVSGYQSSTIARRVSRTKPGLLSAFLLTRRPFGIG